MKFICLSLLCCLFLSSCNNANIKESVKAAQKALNEGRYEEADSAISLCLNAAEKNPEIYVIAALAKAENGKKEETAQIIPKAEKLLSENAEALAHLGLAYMKIESYPKALALLEKSHQLDPDNEYTAVLLVGCEYRTFESSRRYALKNKYLKLIERFDHFKQTPEYYNLKVVTHVQKGGFNNQYAMNTLQKALNVDPKYPAALLNLAIIYDSVLKVPRRAITCYNNYINAVKLLPKESTKVREAERRVTELQEGL